MSRKTISTLVVVLILTLVGVNAASAADWDSYRIGDTVYVESNYDEEDEDPDNGIVFHPTTYFMIEGDELFILHAERPYFFLPVGTLPLLSEYLDPIEQTFLEFLEDAGFEWDTYDLEDVQQIVFFGSEVGDLVRNTTDIPSTMHGGDSRDWLIGGSASDTIYGNGGHDDLSGEDGDDTLFGGTGDDVIRGEGDNDTMFGNQGADMLSGSAGDDYYDYGYDAFEQGSFNDPNTYGEANTIVLNYEKSSINGNWYPSLPTFLTGQGPMEYSENYWHQRMNIKKRYVTKYRSTFYNPDPSRQPSGIDTSQIDRR